MGKNYSSDTKWKDKTIQGATFPDAPYRWDLKIKFSKEMTSIYIPELKIFGLCRGFELLLEAMTHKEGFYKGTRSFRSNNPGNIGNTDNGKNVPFESLAMGIYRQIKYVEDMVAGKLSAYPMDKRKRIPPFHSAEIAKNPDVYGMSPYLPGYDFIFTAQLDQYVKIYSTGARGGNGYINIILSHFKANGFDITPESKIQDIILLH